FAVPPAAISAIPLDFAITPRCAHNTSGAMISGRRPFVLKTQCTRLRDKVCGIRIAYCASPPSSVTEAHVRCDNDVSPRDSYRFLHAYPALHLRFRAGLS